MRTSQINRKTKETDISLSLCLDGGEVSVNTGIGFFDHMLNSFAVHGGFGLIAQAKGDLQVDDHHTVEDVGIVLGTAFKQALGERISIERFGTFFVPMDDALAYASVDISGRPFLVFDAEFPQEYCGEFSTAMIWEFMRAFAYNASVTLHTRILYGNNSHHMAEAMFKAVAHALKIAVAQNNSNVPLSTKGVL